MKPEPLISSHARVQTPKISIENTSLGQTSSDTSGKSLLSPYFPHRWRIDGHEFLEMA